MKFFSGKTKKELFFYLVASVAFGAALFSFFQEKFTVTPSVREDGAAVISVFAREKCSHCQDEKKFLEAWQEEDPALQYQILDIEKSEDANKMFLELTDLFELSKSTPITIVGDRIFVGFDTAENMGSNIREYYTDHPALPSFAEIWEQKDTLHSFGPQAAVCTDESEECAIVPQIVTVPFFGEIDVSRYKSPSVLSFILGFIDGFNPCAMWVLVMFLIALMQIGDRFKMFVTAGIFLFAEAVMYTLILTAWFSTWNFVGLDRWITPLVGFIAIGAGFFFLHEGIFSDGTCKVTNVEQKKKISQKIQDIASSPLTIPTILGILMLAFSVNIIEFACSIGIPQTFTQILHLSDLPLMEKAWYIDIYILAYMIDDLIVFGIALYSIEKLGVTHKYAKASNLLGGGLMLLLGLLLIFAPEILAFS